MKFRTLLRRCVLYQESRLQQVFAEAAADSGTNGQEPSEVADRPKKRRLDEETPFVPTTNVANQVTTEKEMPGTSCEALTLLSVPQLTVLHVQAHEGSQDLKRCVAIALLSAKSIDVSNTCITYRDRENCTVSVTGLSTTAQEEDVRKLFRDVSMPLCA